MTPTRAFRSTREDRVVLIKNVEGVTDDEQTIRVIQPTLEGRDVQKRPHRIGCHATMVAVWLYTLTSRLEANTRWLAAGDGGLASGRVLGLPRVRP